ncbi:MAG: transposase, partial [bacterium]
MKPDLPIRKPTRIEGYDYSTPGAYFVTVCCQNRKRYFDFAPAKAMVEGVWRVIPDRFPNAEIDVFVVMPDHFHGIIILKPNMIHPVGEALVASRIYGTDHDNNDPPVGEALVASRIAEKETLADVEKREGTSPSPTKVNKTAGLTEIIGAFKSKTTWKYSLGVKDNGWPKYTKKIWQRSFYDHIIRTDQDL